MIREGETVEQAMERLDKKRDRETNIWCPYCDTKQDTDTQMDYVTYWGEYEKDTDKECNCEKCGKKFMVEESVDRTYTTEKIEEENEKE